MKKSIVIGTLFLAAVQFSTKAQALMIDRENLTQFQNTSTLKPYNSLNVDPSGIHQPVLNTSQPAQAATEDENIDWRPQAKPSETKKSRKEKKKAENNSSATTSSNNKKSKK